MKLSIMVIIAALGIGFVSGQPIYSTLTGGNWSDPMTWVGQVVPGDDDDVFIEGPVLADISSSCQNLTVSETGSLMNQGSRVITVSGSFDNAGTIANNPAGYSLTLNVAGDFSNSGTMSHHDTNLTGSNSIQFSMTGGEFSGTYLDIAEAGKIVSLESNLTFSNTMIDLSDATLISGGSITVFLTGGFLRDGIWEANGSTLSMAGNSYTDDMVISNVVLEDTVQVAGNVFFTESATNNGTVQNYSSSRVLTIQGSITNNGSIRNNPAGYSLTVSCQGDLTNNGDWNTYDLNLEPVNEPGITITTGSDSYFQSTYIDRSAGDYAVSIASDAVFYHSSIDLNDGVMILSQPSSLTLHNSILRDGTLNANNNGLALFDNSYLNDISVDSAVTDGIIQVSSTVYFTGGLINNGSLVNYSNSSYTVTVDGNLVNNSIIGNNESGNTLTMVLDGNLTNYGSLSNSSIQLAGVDDITIDFGESGVCSCSYFRTSSLMEGNLTAVSELHFVGTELDFNDAVLTLPADGLLSVVGGVLRDFQIIGSGSVIHTSDGAYFNDITADNIELAGTARISGNVTFTTSVTVQDTLENNYNSSYTLTVDGDLMNNGTIRNSPAGYNFSMNISGNISQNGVWDFYQTSLTGLTDQWLSQSEGSLFSGSRFLDTNSSSGIHSGSPLSFQGMELDLNGAVLTLEDGHSLTITGTASDCITDGTIMSNGNAVHTSGGFYLSGIMIENGAVLSGDITISGTVTALGQVVLNGMVMNRSNSSYTLVIDGDLINNGSIADNSAYSLFLQLTGNLENYGLISNYSVSLTGDSAQSIQAGEGIVFSPGSFTDSNASSAVYFLSPLAFENTTLDFNNAEAVLEPGANLTISGSESHSLNDVVITGSHNIITASGGMYLNNVHADNIVLDGVHIIAGNIVLSGEIQNIGEIRNRSNSSYTLQVEGNLVNEGAISNNIYSLQVEITGDLTNSGSIDVNRLRFRGAEPQSITAAGDAWFGMTYFDTAAPNTAVNLASSVEFSGVSTDLNGSTLTIGEGNILGLSGGYLSDCTLSAGSVNSGDGAYLSNLELVDITLQGETLISSNVVSSGLLVNEGFLWNRNTGSYHLDVNGNVWNRGSLADNPNGYQLTFDVSGTLVSEGSWQPYRTYLDGASDQDVLLISGMDMGDGLYLESQHSGSSMQWYRDGVALDSDAYNGENSATLGFEEDITDSDAGTYYCISTAGQSRNFHFAAGTIGCMDPASVNYDPNAVWDDGSCMYAVYGCTDENACNYDPNATIDNGSCLYDDCSGECGGVAYIDDCGECVGGSTGMMPNWAMDDCGVCFGENADMDCRGVCFGEAFENECGCVGGTTGLQPDFCYGCMDETAFNYDPNAVFDDESCYYGAVGDMNGDQTINVLDVVVLVEGILEQEFDEYESWAGDVSGDGAVNVLDVVMLVDIILSGALSRGEPLSEVSYRLSRTLEIFPNGAMAACQISVTGNLQTVSDDLPDGWFMDQRDGIILIYNTAGLSIEQKLSLRTVGDGDVTELLAADWHGFAVAAEELLLPERAELGDAFPNPFNPVTKIPFTLPKDCCVDMKVYNIRGQQVCTLLENSTLPAGSYNINWNAGESPSGAYMIHLTTGNTTRTAKVILMK